MQEPGTEITQYGALYRVLLKAYFQASAGKGKERHAEDKAFEDQDICSITRDVGIGFAVGQAIKKSKEAVRMLESKGGDFAVKEWLGAIVYLSAAVIVTENHETKFKVHDNDGCQGEIVEKIGPGEFVTADEKEQLTWKPIGFPKLRVDLGK